MFSEQIFGLTFCSEMAIGLRLEDRLDGAANFIHWKARIVLILQENELYDEVVSNTQTKLVQVPASTDAVALAAFNKDFKANRIILDAVKDHVIPHMTSKDFAYEMWDALINLYQSSNENRKMVLREKLKSIRMVKAESVTSYLARITQVRDELGAIGEKVEGSELVRTSLNGMAKP